MLAAQLTQWFSTRTILSFLIGGMLSYLICQNSTNECGKSFRSVGNEWKVIIMGTDNSNILVRQDVPHPVTDPYVIQPLSGTSQLNSEHATTPHQNATTPPERATASPKQHTIDTERFCTKPLFRLWSQNLTQVNNESFPMCKTFFDAIQHKSPKEQEQILASAVNWTIPAGHNDSSIFELVSNCSTFRQMIDFPEKPASVEEAEFPLAYVFVGFKHAAQTVRLFRMLYQPQNAYCITYDKNSETIYKEAIVAMASCFPSNVYLNPNPETITYTMYSLLHSVMECMKVLRRSSINWRYVQVVSWNDFPLRSNWEMVKIFKALNGSQDTELYFNDMPSTITTEGSKGQVRRPIPPAGITFYKGSFSASMTREFIDFLFDNPISVRFYEYINGVMWPDEYYWSSLIYDIHLNAPGGYPGECYLFYMGDDQVKPYISRFQVWSFKRSDPRLVCKRKWVHNCCVFGIMDLPTLIEAKPLIAHKLYEDYQPSLQYCLEEWYWERVCLGDTKINMTYYENLPSVVYHNLPDAEKDKYVCGWVE